MPENVNQTYNLHDCTIEERSKHTHTCQLFWYEYVTQWTDGKTVLDVGAGRGDGMDVIMTNADICIGIDPLPLNDRVDCGTIDSRYIVEDNIIENASIFDVVLAMDVIEHVEFDSLFLNHMYFLASDYIFFSTPNYNVHKCKNQYHMREYTPAELLHLIKGYNYRIFEADAKRNILEVHQLEADSKANDFGVLIKL